MTQVKRSDPKETQGDRRVEDKPKKNDVGDIIKQVLGNIDPGQIIGLIGEIVGSVAGSG